MQSQCRYKEEKDQHDAQFDENSKTNLPNSRSSILKKCVAQETPVFQNMHVAMK